MWCRSFCINDIFSFKYNMIHVVEVIRTCIHYRGGKAAKN
jgi:hypothetical protein